MNMRVCVYVRVCLSKSDHSDKIKRESFQAVAVPVQLYAYAIWTLMKCLQKKQDRNYTRMLCIVCCFEQILEAAL